MATIYYMRFKLRDSEDHLYFVGDSPDKMRSDASIFGDVDPAIPDGEVINSETVIEEAEKRCFPERTLRGAVHAARTGFSSYYLFG